MARLQNKVVIITGGASGQGAAEAQLCIEEGACVVVADVLADRGEALVASLGSRARFVRADSGNAADWADVVRAAAGFGGLHGLVNNAGILHSGGLAATTLDRWEELLRVNQTGPFLGMQAVIEPMLRSGGGSIVNVSSIAGLRAAPQAFAYSATKWALRGMTKSAALEFASNGIRVNSVHPGPVDTEMLGFWTPERRAERVRQLPLARMATAEEIARPVIFLLSDEASYITGAEIAVDGGVTA